MTNTKPRSVEEKKMHDDDKNLLKRALVEIEQLRGQVQRLGAYHDHTERLLAMFEGGPRSQGEAWTSDDVAGDLRRRIAELAAAEDTTNAR